MDLASRWWPETETVSIREADRIREEQRFRSEGVRLRKGEWEAHPDATDGPVPDRAVLPLPFDRLVSDRDRAEALWGFRYRLEMFVPKAKREYGYYVLPLLVGDQLAGRAEPRFDRKSGTLELLGAWGDTSRLDEALDDLAAWLGAASISEVDFETRAIHDGQEPDPATGAIITPIYQTSTYVQEAVGVHKGYDYARVANPTRTSLQTALASLENAEHGIAFSSGLGATTTLMHLVNPGERVVLIADVYGGVYRMTSQVYEPKGYVFDYVLAPEFANLAEHLDGNTRMVWIESPSNPMLNVVDIRAGSGRRAHAVGAILVVDNTFATPYLQNPLDLGADAVVHSTTKYLGGHSDVVGGFRRNQRPDNRGAALLPAEVARRRAGAVRLLARPARDQDAGRADAPALRERAGDRRLAGAAAGHRAGALPRLALASRARDRKAADAGFRRNDLLPRRQRGNRR